MLKFLLIFAVAVGTAFGVPAIRDRITPPLAPLLDRLGPVGKGLGTPGKKLAARNEASVILKVIAEQYAQTKTIPEPLRFQVWMKMNLRGGRDGMDPWGRPYYLVQANRQLTVGSQGPDMQRNTADDIRVSVPF